MIKEIFDLGYTGHKSSGKFSISSIGKCRKRMFLEMKGKYKEEYTPRTLRTFGIGDAFHRLACGEIMSKGEQLGLHVVAAEVPIPEHPFMSGRTDQMVADKNGEIMIVDVKSCSKWTIDKVRQGEVSDAYIWQVQLYLHFFKLKRGYLLFYEKTKGDVEEYEVLYDKELCERLIEEVRVFMEENVSKDVEPGSCDGGDFGCPCCFPLFPKKEKTDA